MTIMISSWLKGRPEQPSDAYATDDITDLVDSMDLAATNADAEDMYMEKYWRLRKAVDEDEICNDLRVENASLRNNNNELTDKVVKLENARLSAELQLMRRENELEDNKAHHKAEIDANNAQNEALKLENKMLKKNEEYMKFLLLSHGIQTPALFTPPQHTQATSPLSTPELTDDDDTDMDDADELDGPAIVCPQWYNHGECNRSGGTGSNKCSRGAHPHLIDFSTPLRP